MFHTTMTSMSEFQDEIEAAMDGHSPNAEGWYRVACPMCHANEGKRDTKGNLSVSALTGFFSCWRCGETGRIDIEYAGEIEIPERKIQKICAPEGYEPLWEEPGMSSPFLAEARRYLIRRLGKKGIRQLCQEVQIGAVAIGREAGRVIVPVRDENLDWVGWVGRDWTGKKRLKYRTAPGMTRILWNSRRLQDSSGFAVVVEGVFDALPYWPHAVACLGKPDKYQIDTLRAAKCPIVVALDGDAWQEGWSLAARLGFDSNQKIGFVRLPPAKDPGSVSADWLMNEAERSLHSNMPTGYEE